MSLENKVVQMYNKIPYPDYGEEALTEDYVLDKEHIDLVLGFDKEGYEIYNDKKILEGGCGTGRESMYIASKGADLTSIDLTDKSLNIAEKQSKKYQFKHQIKFIKASVLDLPFQDSSFDIVLSSGVIHHTTKPYKAFRELCRVLKPNGIIILYVYNNWAHVFSNFRRYLVNILSNDTLDDKVNIAKTIFPFYTRNLPLATIYDEFAHPHKSEHSIKEVIRWFNDNNIVYNSVYPKFGFSGAYKTYNSKKKYSIEFYKTFFFF